MTDKSTTEQVVKPTINISEDIFLSWITAGMDMLFDMCTKKVNYDYGDKPGIVTERQIEHSLRNLPVSVRSSMIQKCFRHFAARKEA